MAIRIETSKCVGCQACLKVCPYDALDLINKKAVLNENCVHCAACIDSCTFAAIVNEVGGVDKTDLSGYRGVVVFIETAGQALTKVATELLGCGRDLADKRGVPLIALLAGAKVEALAAECAAYGADRVLLVESPELASYRTGPFARAVVAALQVAKPEIVLFGATVTGRDLAPRVANRLRTGLTADCTGLAIEEGSGLLLQTRPAFGGNVMATIACPRHRPQMSTVRPGVMKARPRDGSRKADVERVTVAIKPGDLKLVVREVIAAVRKSVDLSTAEIIVAGGRGTGGAKGFRVIEELAAVLGGEVGASRAAVEAGWIDHDHQVGQTGKAVSPKLYIACGISGAIQHLAGISGADCVVAINRDRDAAIFGSADFGIVGDLMQVVPMLQAEIKRIRAKDLESRS